MGGFTFSYTYCCIAVSASSELCKDIIPQTIKPKNTPSFKKSFLLCAYFVLGSGVTYSCTAVSVSPAPATIRLDLYVCWSFGGPKGSLWGSCLNVLRLGTC